MDYYHFCKKIKYSIKSVKFEIKYFFQNFPFKKKIQNYLIKKRRARYKKELNFIKTRDFINKFGLIEIDKNPFEYGIDLYNVTDGYIGCYGEYAFVHQYGDGKMYTLQESSGINRRIDEDEIRYEKPLNLKKNVIEEDEICMLCFFNAYNYWHFTFDVLPKLLIMEKLGYKGKYLVNPTGCSRPFFEMIGFPEERLVYCKHSDVIKAKKLYMFHECYGIELGGKWLQDTREYVMKLIEDKNGSLYDEKFPKHLYVSRIGSRRIINEKQLVDYLKPKGFAVMIPEQHSLFEQIKFFANADVVVTPHGANATNILYSKEGTTLVECFGHYWVNPCMVTTVDILGIDYHMICERFMHNIPNSGRFSNYIIDIVIFRCIMEKIFEYWNLKKAQKVLQ